MPTLTAAEKKWLKKLQKALNECPSKRMRSHTIGDNDIIIHDYPTRCEWENKNPEKRLDMGDVVEQSGSYLATLDFPFAVESAAH